MDLEVYRKYLPGDALGNSDLEWMIPLPCDVDYYSSKEDVHPALTLEEGTMICIAPGGSGMNQALTKVHMETTNTMGLSDNGYAIH